MNFKVKKAAVLGSGVMGSGIACHLANVGIDVLMLDIQPKDKSIKTTNETNEINEVVVTEKKNEIELTDELNNARKKRRRSSASIE